MSRFVLARRLTVALSLFLFMFAAPVSADPVKVIASGLGDPRGIDAHDGDHGDRLLVVETATGAITEILTKKAGEPIVRPFAENVFASDVVGYGFNAAFASAGGPPEEGAEPAGAFVRVPRGGPSTLIADILAYQATDPDPVDQEDLPYETNPFGVAQVRHGFLVADSAGNDLLKIEKDGDIETVARFPTRSLPFPEGIPGGPPAGTLIDAEAVPTAVAVGPDGAWYVSELRGFPFTKGASRIWRIEPGTEDVMCDPDAKRGPCRVFADGFTSVIDIAWAGKTLLVLEIAKDGLLALEGGAEGAPPPPGALWAAEKGKKTQIAAGELIAPGGVAVADDDLYVTTGTLFGPGGGAVVKIKDAVDDDHGHHGDNGHHGDGGDHHGGDRDHADKDRKKHKKHKGGKHKNKKHKNKKSKKRDRDDD